MDELQPADFPRAFPVFQRIQELTPLRAIFDGRTPSRLFVDDLETPQSAFIWNDFRYSYLAGNTKDTAFMTDLAELLQCQLFPEAKNSPDPTLVLYPDSPEWEQHINSLIGGRQFFPVRRHRFVYPDNTGRKPAAMVPSGYQLRRLDADLLTNSEIAETIDILWHSPETFLADGFGFCLMAGNTILSLCLTGFVGGGQAELDVRTHPDYRGRGLAILTSQACIQHSLAYQLIPTWECWAENTPSIKLAEKLGFKHAADYPVFFVPPEQ